MPGGTTMRIIGRKRGGGRERPPRFGLAVALVMVALIAAWAVLHRDVSWRRRGQAAKRLGDTAYSNGNYVAARSHYLSAVTNNRYDWEAHLALATILNHNLGDPEGALRHYLYTLAYSPDPGITEAVRRNITILRLIRSGELENPIEAIEDLFQSIESNAKRAFVDRLELRLRKDAGAYWEGWSARGRGSVATTKITSNHEGLYDAAVELHFPDETTMLVHLQCPLRDTWRLNLSFP